MNRFKYFLPLLLALGQPAFSEAIGQDKIIAYSEEQLSLSGMLKKQGDFLYVDVEDAYIHDLIREIENEGFTEPPYFGSSDLVGAHITVMYPDEVKEHGIQDIEECGQTIGFSLKDCQLVSPPRWNEVESVYVLTVEAPALDALRAKYGLPEKRHAFHITIGIKLKDVS